MPYPTRQTLHTSHGPVPGPRDAPGLERTGEGRWHDMTEWAIFERFCCMEDLLVDVRLCVHLHSEFDTVINLEAINKSLEAVMPANPIKLPVFPWRWNL